MDGNQEKEIKQVVVGVCTNRHGEFLLGKRFENDSYGGLWEFPGGKVEEDESQRNALRREWKEELDVEIDVKRKLGSVYGLKSSYSGNVFNLHAYSVKILPKNVPKPIEVESIKWLNKNKISTLTRSEFVDILVKMYSIFYSDR